MRTFLLSFLLMLGASTQAQEDYQNIFNQLTEEGNWETIPSLLQGWESANPNDAQLFVAKFNYFFHECRKEMVQMTTEEPEVEHMVINDTMTGEAVGYMYSALVYDDSIFSLAIQSIEEGLKLYPKRLDMHFGKIYVLREKGEIGEHINAVLRVIRLHEKYHDEWLWANNEPIEDINEMFTGSMQDYCYALFNMAEPRIDGVEQISMLMTQLYPADVRFYSNLGACKLMTQDFSSALQFFLAANEKQKNDAVVLSNIAYAYLLMEQPDSAKLYYQQLETKGDVQQAAFAREQIEQIDARK